MSKKRRSIYELIMGKHPYNTIFSYNYLNIRHILHFIKRYVSGLNTEKKKIIIDVGGGRSPYFELFAPYTEKYYVVDLAAALPEKDERAIIRQEGRAENLKFDNAYADIILSNQVLEHIDDVKQAVKEAYRVLKNGGVFIGSVPHISPIHLEPYDYRRFTAYGLRKTLEESGFKDIVIEGNGGVYRAAAFLILMDIFLNRNTGKGQSFNAKKHLLLAPLTAFINLFALLLDWLLADKKRSPSNYCWIAKK